MVPWWKVQAVEALLAEDALTQRAIAKRLKVSRGVVAGIAQGRRPDYRALREAAAEADRSPLQPTQRCLQCGAMVQLPCLACRLRQALVHRGRGAGPDLPAAAEGLQLRLLGVEWARYEEVRARRRLLLPTESRARSADRRLAAM